MKKCPYCAEDIQDAAIVCKHCGRDLPPPVVAPPSPTPEANVQRVGRYLIYSIFLLVAAVAVVAMITGLGGEDDTAAPEKKTLSVSVRTSATHLEISNEGSPAGIPITIYINGTPPFTYRTDATMPPNGETVLRVPLMEFTKKDGERFDPRARAVTEVWIGGNGYDYRKFGS